MLARHLKRRRRRSWSVLAVWLSVMLVAVTIATFSAAVPPVLAAGDATYLDLSPETATYGPGSTVTITARVYDENDILLTET